MIPRHASIDRVRRLVDQGCEPVDIALAVPAEMLSLFGVDGCRFEPSEALAGFEHGGSPRGASREAVALPVRTGGGVMVGSLVFDGPASGVSNATLEIAGALADLLGRSIEASRQDLLR